MNRFSKFLRAANWRYAIGEIFLIFVGITLALYANSWYENRAARIEEAEILQQIVHSLDTDIAALESRIRMIENKLQTLAGLQEHINSERGYEPHLDVMFREVITGGSAQLSTSAFETLAFRGIDLVSDPALRNRLVDYYDTERTRLEQRNDLDSRDAWAAEPFFKTNFRWDSDDLSMMPLDYDALVNNAEFLNILAIRIWTQKSLAAEIHQQVIRKAEALRAAILEHLDTL